MDMAKFLIISAFLFLTSSIQGANPSDVNCELKLEVQITDSPSNLDEKSVLITVLNGSGPYNYFFFDEVTGRLLEKDLSRNSIHDLKTGKYYCLVIDKNSCSKKIQFRIQ